jgi:NAD(P)-dependent dehydrogenase (short-subunit alcohol dehydrogenase family)
VAIVTGGARGLGEADARAFVAEGALVTITDLDQTLSSALATELGCHFMQHDVSDESRWP